MSEKKVLGLLGLAQKAGKTADGGFSVEQVLKAGRAKLVIAAEDASVNTKKKYTELCQKASCPLLILSNKQELAHAIGKEERSGIAILDKSFADAIIKQAETFTVNRGE